MRRIILCLLCLLPAFPALASDADMESLHKLMDATRSRGYAQAQPYVTERSMPLMDRLWKQGVPLFFPEKASLKKKKEQGGYRYLWVSPADNPKAGSLILAFTDEDGQAKLDLPETFRNGLGEDWPKQLDMLEQGYIMAKAQMGEEAALKLIQGMMRGYQNPAASPQ